MEEQQGKYVRNLKAWSLPRIEDMEGDLVDELAAKARTLYFDRDLFAEEFYVVFLDRIREIAGCVSDTVIDYWAKGYADGNDGQYPELCLEFPYLQGNEDVDPLTISYCVDNQDGSRTELSRIPLEEALTQLIESEAAPAPARRRVKATVSRLRELADKIDRGDSDSGAD
jgi:hypothetical protein